MLPSNAKPQPVPLAGPVTAHITGLENATLQVTLAERMTWKMVDTPDGPRIRVTGAGITLEATAIQMTVDRQRVTIRATPNGSIVKAELLPGPVPEKP